MPLTPQEYLDWWLTTALDPLKELVDKEALGCGPQHVGFEQTVQRRQRGFDNDVELQEALRLHVKRLSSHQTPEISCNPRNKLRELTLNVFKKPEDGGLVPDRVLDGLADLNAVELRRRRLVAETPLIFRPGHPAFGSAAMIQELNKKATEKFGQFYMGFRASMVIEELKQARVTRKPSVEIMAVVNALFPAHDLLKNSEDISLVPCTDSLLGCIRFTVLYHLLGDNPSSDKQQAMIQEKLFIWCSLPRYQAAYKAFAQYIEEFKTIESLCFSVLQLAQKESSRRKSGSHRPSFTPNSVVMVKSILKGSPQSPREVENLAGSRRSISPELVASAPPVPNPLLKGLPGREVSPSKTDGAAFAFDDPSAPKLRVENTSTLSKTAFDQHPLAKDLNLNSREKAQLGLLLPKQKNRRKFYRKLKKKPLPMKQKSLPTRQKSLPTKQKLLETKQKLLSTKKKQLQARKKKEDDDIPPVPPTPDIPESMKATITRTSLRLLQRMRSQPEMQQFPQIASILASKKARSSTKLAKPSTRPKAAHGQIRDSFYLRTSSFPEASIRSSQHSLYTQRAPSTQSVDRAGAMGRQDGTAAQEQASLSKPEIRYSMCQPRLSNMEYTRLYLVEEANAKKEKRACELPPPRKVWLWGPRWEEFLVLPKLPASIRRRFSLNSGDEEKKPLNLEPLGQGHDSDADSVETVKGKSSVPAKPPRLSLNLENMASSLMHFVSIDSEKANQFLGRPQTHEAVQASGQESPVLGRFFAAEYVRQSCAPTIDKPRDPPPTPAVSSASTGKNEEEDLYSDDRHLWPSPMIQRGTWLAPISPISEEITESMREERDSVENTTPQLSDDTFETSSIYSNDSARTAVFLGSSKEAADTPKTPQTARHHPEQLTTPDEASPVRPGIPFSYSCASFNSLSSDRSSLTHFPISAEQRSRATTEEMVQDILNQSGGRLCVEDARQVRLVERKRSAEIQASSADIWNTNEYMEPELQPAPLNLSKKPSIAKAKHGLPELPLRPKNLGSEAPQKFHEKIKSYESGFVPLPGSLLYEADKNTDIIRIPRSLSSSSNSSSSISAIITPSRPGPTKGTNYANQRSERVTKPRPSRSMNELYDATSPSNGSQSQPRKPSPTLSDLDEFFGVGPYEKAFLEKHPEAAKPFVLPPKLIELPEAPVFTAPAQATLMLRRRDKSTQQHRALPLPDRGTQQLRTPPQPTVQRVMERKPNTSVNVSSFALHRAQGTKATILPVVEGRSRANTTNTRGRELGNGQDHDYEDSISEEHMPQQTFLDDVHRFSLQRYDVSARRPLTAHARPDTLFEQAAPISPAENVASEGKKITNTPATTLGNLFRRRNRNRKEN
ncbi:hypothetical protein GGI35DRAFT_478105 [Trichoderma velutinum]